MDEDTDRQWLDITFRFFRHVNHDDYAKALWTEAMAIHGYSPADVPDEGDWQGITDTAYRLLEEQKRIRREAFRAAPPPDQLEWIE